VLTFIHSLLHTQLLQKTGQIERTVDQDFASEETKYKVCVHFHILSQLWPEICANRFEKECGILQKDGKAYLDSMRGTLAIFSPLPPPARACVADSPRNAAMSSAQLRLAETIDTFYGASDRNSESAMAAHAYKRSVEELDAGISRELVRVLPLSLPPLPVITWGVFFFPPQRSATRDLLLIARPTFIAGCPLSYDNLRSTRKDELVFPDDKRAHLETE
jgi:hypothetical protein